MKKSLFAAAAAIVLGAAVVSCSGNGSASQQENQYTILRDYAREMITEYTALDADNTLTEEQKDAKAAAIDSVFQIKARKAVEEALEQHPADSISAKSLILAYQFEVFSEDEFFEKAQSLPDSTRAYPMLARIMDGIACSKRTAEGTMFLDFSAQQPDGKVKKLSDYVGRGKYCLVDFWASWCGPCKGEIPNIAEVYKKYGKKGLTVVSVAVWDKPEASADTAKAYGITWNQILGAGQTPTELYGIQGIPHIILFGPDGTILKRNLRGADIRKEVAKYL